MDLLNKVAVVTGGAQGIGEAICKALLQHQAKVLFTDINVIKGKETEKELQKKHGEKNIIFFKCDVTSDQEFEDAVVTAKRKFGHFDILVNNAGIGGESIWQKVVDVNLKGVMRGTLLAKNHLIRRDGVRGGTVINVASILGLKINSLSPSYCATKHAIVAWTRCWGAESNVQKTGMKVCAICPAGVDTPMSQCMDKDTLDDKVSKLVKDHVYKDIMQPSVIAETVIKLLEDGKSGAIMSVTHDKGVFYVDFPDLI